MYWITNNCFSLAQSIALKNPQLRDYLDFAKSPPPDHSAAPAPAPAPAAAAAAAPLPLPIVSPPE